MGSITIENIAGFDTEIANNSTIIAKFETRSCVICRRMEPGLNAIEERNQGKFKIIHIDADDHLLLAERCNVRGVPTLILFENGKEVSRVNGFQSASMLNQWLAPHL